MQAALADFFMFKLLTGRPDTGYMTTPTHHPHPNPQWTPQCSDKPDRVLQHWLKDCACYCRGCVNSRAGHKWKVSWTGRLVKVQAFDWLTWHWLQDPPPPPPPPHELHNVPIRLTSCYSTGWKVAHVVVEAVHTVEFMTYDDWDAPTGFSTFKPLTGCPDISSTELLTPWWITWRTDLLIN